MSNIRFTEIDTPTSPPAGKIKVFMNNGVLKQVDENGIITAVFHEGEFYNKTEIDDLLSDKQDLLSKGTLVNATGDYTIDKGDNIINVTGDNAIITLPTADDKAGISYKIDNATTDDITLDTTGDETIQGESSQIIPIDSCASVYSDGTNWRFT